MTNSVNKKTPKEEHIEWTLTDNTLFLKGKGKMDDYDTNHLPKPEWEKQKDEIFQIEIAEGIEEIGINAFKDCKNLKKVFLPSTLIHIRSYAFKGCSKLTDIHSFKKFQYVYEKSEFDKDNTILFGVEAFSGTSWVKRFGDFYIRNHSLYFTITNSKNIVVPEGVKVLKNFCLSHLDVDTIHLPDSLEVIEDFAFFKTSIKEMMCIPASVHTVSDYAVHDCIALWKDHPVLEATVRKFKNDPRAPKLWEPYSVHFLTRKAYGPFKPLKVVKGIAPKSVEENGPTVVLDSNTISDEDRHSKSKRDLLVCVSCNKDEEISNVRSYFFAGSLNAILSCTLYPKYNLSGKLVGYFYELKTPAGPGDTINPFKDEDGKTLFETDSVTTTADGTHEIWFLYTGNYEEPGLHEFELLTYFMKQHPDYTFISNGR